MKSCVTTQKISYYAKTIWNSKCTISLSDKSLVSIIGEFVPRLLYWSDLVHLSRKSKVFSYTLFSKNYNVCCLSLWGLVRFMKYWRKLSLWRHACANFTCFYVIGHILYIPNHLYVSNTLANITHILHVHPITYHD